MKGGKQRFVTGHKLTNYYGNKNKVFNDNRVCKEPGCRSKLSKYNKRDKCFVHADNDNAYQHTRTRGKTKPTIQVRVKRS